MSRQTRASNREVDSGRGVAESVRAVKTRRSHKKSRNGCTECKKRHIRCDERQPVCTNCEAGGRTCVFPPPKAAKQKHKQRPWQQYHATENQTLEATAAPSPSPEASDHSNSNSIDNADTAPAHHRHVDYAEFGPAPDQHSRRSTTEHLGVPFISILDADPQRLISPALSSPFDDLQNLPGDCHPSFAGLPDAAPELIFTSQHMVLLRYADTVPNFTGPDRNVVDIAIRYVVGSPYLLDEILAFTAFHLTHVYPGSAAHLQQLATELQTRALASFNCLTKLVPTNDRATAVPRFLFSAILGRHVLADTLAHHCSDIHSFVDRFVDCLVLNRGIRAVTPPARHFLNDSEIKPFLNVVLGAEKTVTSPGGECDPLGRLIDDSDLSEVSAKACRQAIQVLQRAFDLCHGLKEEDYPQAAVVFPVGIDSGFLDVLRKHRPEALIILAYYGVLLHRCRSWWAFGGSGTFVISAVATHVGTYWQEVLAWPLHVLETERNPEQTKLALRHDFGPSHSPTPRPS